MHLGLSPHVHVSPSSPIPPRLHPLLQDGWTTDAFHLAVDGYGPALVLGRTVGGAVIGGYNPLGFDG